MKSERRHELDQNWLADRIAGSVNTVKPHTNAILGIALAVLILAVAAVLWIQKSRADAARSWEDFYLAAESNDFLKLEKVIEQYPGADAAQWAAAVVGDLHLNNGCQELFSNKLAANQELTKAIECYQEVLNQSKTPTLRERATFGMARALEAHGELARAETRYQELVNNWPDGPYAEIAQLRIEDLKRPATKEFYDRFKDFDPKPAFSDAPGTPGERPPFETDSLPQPGESALPALETMKLEEKAAEKPAEKPAEAKPAAEKPAETKPAEAKPVETKPAETPAADAAKPAEPPKSEPAKSEPAKEEKK